MSRYWLVSTVRRVETRLQRAQSPERHRFKQDLCNGQIRLVRGPAGVELRPDLLEQFKEELKSYHDRGILNVHVGSPEGPLYDFRELVEKAPPPPKEPTPEPAPELDEPEPEAKEMDEDDLPDMTWTKTRLMSHAATVLGKDESELEPMTKREILEKLS